MSPVQAMERSYSALKHMLRDGHFAPGTRLEANRLADELGVSMTPVRDVLHRLVGERLVEASTGDGFHVPRFTEAGLRDLYEWHSALTLIAIRTARQDPAPLPENAETSDTSLAERTSQLFESIAAAAPNREIRAAIASASDRLHPFRLVEPQALEPMLGELDVLAIFDARLPQAVRRYHLRRMKAVPDLLGRRNAD
jgi:DNA-binding GntR family transcriptional regulator